MTLYKPHLRHDQGSLFYDQAAKSSENAALIALRSVDVDLDQYDKDPQYGDIPPFVLPWIYKAGIWFIDTGATDELKVIETALYKLNAKWRAAGNSNPFSLFLMTIWLINNIRGLFGTFGGIEGH